jgi:hypothetical protein
MDRLKRLNHPTPCYPKNMDIARQLDAVDTLLTDTDVLRDTLEVELHLYRERLAAATACR